MLPTPDVANRQSRGRQIANRVAIFLAFCLTMAALGALGGYLAGRFMAIRLAKTELAVYATRILSQGEESSAESRAVLARLNASPYPSCSDLELSYFRSLLFQSEYIKDAGRVRNGRIVCTANAGRLNPPIQLPRLNFAQPDRTKVYLDVPQFKVPGLQLISLQLDRSFLVFSPYLFMHPDTTAMHYTVTVLDQSSQKAGRVLGNPPTNSGFLTREGEARENNILFATRCSSRFFNCVTAYMGIAEVLKKDAAILPGYPILAGIAGGLLGVAILLLDARSKSTKNRLRRAVLKGEIDVLYQPLVNLSTRRIIGAEALIRWADYDGYTLSPQLIVQLAEQDGFIGDITELVLKRGVRELGTILRSRSDFKLNINISAVDLSDPILLPMLERTLEKAAIPAQRIGIELTESSTADRALAKDVIMQLRRMGHYICIDDFGTGYSSLSYLQDLAVDAIKIDRSFTKAIGTDSVTVSILPQILAISRSLNLQVVAEGIETENQAMYFTRAGKDVMGQGWLFGLPLSAENLIQAVTGEGTAPTSENALSATR